MRFLFGLFQERADFFHEIFAVVVGTERAGHAHGIAEEEMFVELLARGKGGHRRVPGETEDGNALVRFGARGLIVLL